MRILLDTNAIIDLFARRAPQGEVAQKLLIMEQFGDVELWASAKSFTDIFYVLSREFDAEHIYAAFDESFKYLNLCSVDGSDVKRASDQRWGGFEDCLVEQCAQKVKADYILTRDKTGFVNSTITAIDPAEFFAQVERELGLSYAEIGLC